MMLGSSHFEFVDSHLHPAVQVSDVISGLLKNYFTFLAQKSVADVVKAKNSLTDKQQECLGLLQKLIEKSDDERPEMLHYVMSQIEHHKHAVFMFDKDARDEFVRVVGGGVRNG